MDWRLLALLSGSKNERRAISYAETEAPAGAELGVGRRQLAEGRLLTGITFPPLSLTAKRLEILSAT